MADTFLTRLKNGWSAFSHREQDIVKFPVGGASYGNGTRPYRPRSFGSHRGAIITPIYNRIAIDVSSVEIRHIRVDENERYIEEMKTYLNDCLTLESNIDQASVAFFRDVTMTLCENGAIAIVPVESKGNPIDGEQFDPTSLRVGVITQWYPRHVRVNLYNDQTGLYQEVLLPKRMAAIVENPLHAVMNEPNSSLQRLLNKLHLLDVIDEQSGSGKLDVIIKLPYSTRHEARKQTAENRRAELEDQLSNSKYGVGYIDASEEVIQLNRAAENNLLSQVEYLTNMLYSELGLTREIIDGTAEEAAMLNYFNRTIEPFLTAITQAMNRTFLSRTARSQGQMIRYYRDPFKLVPVSQIAEISDKFTRNEIASSNDIRSVIGWKPSSDPKADELRNSNLSYPAEDKEPVDDIIEGEVVEESDNRPKQIERLSKQLENSKETSK